MPSAPRADARHAAARCPPTRTAGRLRSSGTACARSPTRSPGELRLESRNLNDITDSYPELAASAAALSSHSAVLDGEIVAFDAQRPPELRRAAAAHARQLARARARRLAKDTPVTYMIFDLLWLDGHSLMGARLRASAASCWPRWSSQARAGRRPSTSSAKARRCCRRAPSRASRGSSPSAWTRPTSRALRTRQLGEDQDVAPPGVRDRRLDAGQGQAQRDASARCCWGSTSPTAALRYVGRVGTRLQRATSSSRSRRLLGPLRRESSPFTAGEQARRARRVFCEPRLVAEVEFGEWTRAGSLRQPAYKGLREDKAASEVVREDADRRRRRRARAAAPARERDAKASEALSLLARETTAERADATVEGRELKLSNLDKVLYPQARLHQARADRVLRRDRAGAARPSAGARADGHALAGRRGGRSRSSRSRRPRTGPTWVAHGDARRASASRSTTSLADDLPTLVWLANLAAIELHTPLARAEATERPTALVFDLDPGAPASDRRVLPRRRCSCRACSRTSACRASPRPRARRACRCTCR